MDKNSYKEKSQNNHKENNIIHECKLSSIKNSHLIELIIEFQNIKNALKILKYNKFLQKKLRFSLTTYQIFSYYKRNKINMLDSKKLLKFSQNITSKLKESSTFKNINFNLSLCILDCFYDNYYLRTKNENILDLNMLNYNLYHIYSSLLQNFGLIFKINLFYSDKFFIDKIYLEKFYKSFINNNKNFVKGISLEIYDKNIINSINDNISIFIKNNSLCSYFNINRVKFSKIKFCKNEMNLIKLFFTNNIKELYFISCKFSKYSIQLLSRYFNQNENNITKLNFHECHIYNDIIEKLIYCDDEKDMEYSFFKSILYKLENLTLSSNKINDSGFNNLCLYFNKNNKFCEQKLTYLNLSNNKLSSNSIKYLLNIENNQFLLKNLENTDKLKGLIYLDLSGNPLGSIAKLIFSWKNDTLTYLILSDCDIRNNTSNNCAFNESNTFNNMIEEEENEANSIEKEKENDKEYLKNNNELDFNEENIELGLQNLLVLDISKNELSPKFLKFLFYNISNLYILNISSCYLENNSFEETFVSKKKSNINTLIMSHNYIETNTIINLYEYGIITNVEELDLFDNNLKEVIVKYLINKKEEIKLKKINVELNFGIENNSNLLYKKYIKYTKYN